MSSRDVLGTGGFLLVIYLSLSVCSGSRGGMALQNRHEQLAILISISASQLLFYSRPSLAHDILQTPEISPLLIVVDLFRYVSLTGCYLL